MRVPACGISPGASGVELEAALGVEEPLLGRGSSIPSRHQ